MAFDFANELLTQDSSLQLASLFSSSLINRNFCVFSPVTDSGFAGLISIGFQTGSRQKEK
jgi:hypothetical protein